MAWLRRRRHLLDLYPTTSMDKEASAAICGALPPDYGPDSPPYQANQPCYLKPGHKWPPHSFDHEFIRAQSEAQSVW